MGSVCSLLHGSEDYGTHCQEEGGARTSALLWLLGVCLQVTSRELSFCSYTHNGQRGIELRSSPHLWQSFLCPSVGDTTQRLMLPSGIKDKVKKNAQSLDEGI